MSMRLLPGSASWHADLRLQKAGAALAPLRSTAPRRRPLRQTAGATIAATRQRRSKASSGEPADEAGRSGDTETAVAVGPAGVPALAGAGAAGRSRSRKQPRITVLGGGVVGLSAATLIQEAYPGACVTVAAEKFLRETTSWGAAGLWEPYKLGAEQDAELINRWGGETYEWFSQIHASRAAVDAGCIATTGYALWTGENVPPPEQDPPWRDVVPHFHRLSDAELSSFAQPYVGGWAYSTLICEGGRYLPWLTRKFQQAGGRIEEVAFADRESLAAYLNPQPPGHPSDLAAWRKHRLDCDVVVNCTGLEGAKNLFGDQGVYPIRGQILRVVAPWIKNYYSIDGTYYIIPNIDTVVMGGTSQFTDCPAEADPADRQAIINNCGKHLPSLCDAKVVTDWVGFRPGRASVRLELVEEEFVDGLTLPVVHNYAHGGAGITLSWGCALDTLELVRQALA